MLLDDLAELKPYARYRLKNYRKRAQAARDWRRRHPQAKGGKVDRVQKAALERERRLRLKSNDGLLRRWARATLRFPLPGAVHVKTKHNHTRLVVPRYS